jgi:Cu(I)/Ag(I) efflux system membrane fusion protein
VRLGQAGDELREVLSGVEEGEYVVTTGNLLIDAQAQLEQGSQEQSLTTHSTQALSSAQQNAAEQLMRLADQLGVALSGDDLAAYNEHAPKLQQIMPQVTEAFGAGAGQLERNASLAPALNLAAARKAFYSFSAAAAEIAGRVRMQGEKLADLKVFECPMVDTAVPGARSPKGRWVQLQGPIRNPFFGGEMLECGAEVKP